MDEKLKFVAAYLRGLDNLSELCRQYGISRKTGHKWVARYLEGGVAELDEHSRRPAKHPHAVSESIVALVVASRQAHPTWGPKKLRVTLARDYPGLEVPSTSTLSRILHRRGLAEQRRRHRGKTVPYTSPFVGYDAPNDVWCADFKGHFALARSGSARCHPATITDGYSRFQLRCTALSRPTEEQTRAVFDSAFREYGLPQAIRTDNGTPFASGGPGGLSKLSVWWIKLVITPERIAVGRPDQNGRHERMHRTLKAEATRPPRSTIPEQQLVFDAFRHEYNHVRPHEALGQRTPASLYTPSSRRYDGTAPDPVYRDGLEPRRVNKAGHLMWQGNDWYVGTALQAEVVALEPVEPSPNRPACWRLYFGPLLLGAVVRGNAHLQVAARDLVPVVPGELVVPTDSPDTSHDNDADDNDADDNDADDNDADALEEKQRVDG